jgi:hypothetical protein
VQISRQLIYQAAATIPDRDPDRISFSLAQDEGGADIEAPGASIADGGPLEDAMDAGRWLDCSSSAGPGSTSCGRRRRSA